MEEKLSSKGRGQSLVASQNAPSADQGCWTSSTTSFESKFRELNSPHQSDVLCTFVCVLTRVRCRHIYEMLLSDHAPCVGPSLSFSAKQRNQIAYRADPRVLSFVIDGADQRAYLAPSAPLDKSLDKVDRVKQKLTGVLLHGTAQPYRAYWTTAAVSTGANLTCTILFDMYQRGDFDDKVELRIQWDGASDNVSYTCFYFFLFLLVHRDELGLTSLKRIVANRLPVGHTHADIDQMFSVFSQYMFGRGGRRREARRFDTVEEFMSGFAECHKTNLASSQRFALAQNWDTYLSSFRTDGFTFGLQEAKCYDLVRAEGKVAVRVKASMADAWSTDSRIVWKDDTVSPRLDMRILPELASRNADAMALGRHQVTQSQSYLRDRGIMNGLANAIASWDRFAAETFGDTPPAEFTPRWQIKSAQTAVVEESAPDVALDANIILEQAVARPDSNQIAFGRQDGKKERARRARKKRASTKAHAELAFDYEDDNLVVGDCVLAQWVNDDGKTGIGVALVKTIMETKFECNWYEALDRDDGDVNGRLKLQHRSDELDLESVWVTASRDRFFGKGRGKSAGSLLTSFKKQAESAMMLKSDLLDYNVV